MVLGASTKSMPSDVSAVMPQTAADCRGLPQTSMLFVFKLVFHSSFLLEAPCSGASFWWPFCVLRCFPRCRNWRFGLGFRVPGHLLSCTFVSEAHARMQIETVAVRRSSLSCMIEFQRKRGNLTSRCSYMSWSPESTGRICIYVTYSRFFNMLEEGLHDG